jgi:hypothetical protein
LAKLLEAIPMSTLTNRASAGAAGAQAYTAALLGILGSRDPFDVLRETSNALRRAVSGLSDKQLSLPEAPGKWSIRQVVQHLADSDLVGGYRVRMVLAHDRPMLIGYDQDLWAERLRYQDTDIEVALGDFGTLRRSNLRLLERASPADQQRVMLHAERGEESIAHMTRIYAGHDLVHLRQIDRIRKAIGVGPA